MARCIKEVRLLKCGSKFIDDIIKQITEVIEGKPQCTIKINDFILR